MASLPLQKSELDELYDALESFDWAYQYSDDMSVWRAGDTEKTKIANRAAQVEGGRQLLKSYTAYKLGLRTKPRRPG